MTLSDKKRLKVAMLKGKQTGRRQGEKEYSEPTTLCESCLQNRKHEWSYPKISEFPLEFFEWPVVNKRMKKAHPRRCEKCV